LKKPIALITGGSSGIGLAAARALAMRGFRVYEVSRREADNPGIFHITGDVTDFDSVCRSVRTVAEREGQIDILVCNAGMGISGAVEFTEAEEAEKLFAVNYFGTVNAVRAAAEALRRSRGVVVCVSSVAAALPIPFQAHYSASKAAVSAFALALRNEVKSFGVDVRIVMPGDTGTGFTAARIKRETGDDVYGGRIARSVAVMERDERGGMSPEAVGSAVARAAMERRGTAVRSVGFKYKTFAVLAKILPVSVVNWILGLLYAQ
jgi:short-subunit dehydrogenase